MATQRRVRRIGPSPPQLSGQLRLSGIEGIEHEVALEIERQWDEAMAPLQNFLKYLQEGTDDGLPAGAYDDAAEIIQAGVAGATGDAGLGWAPGNHIHPISTDVPVELGAALAEGSSAALARADHVHPYWLFPSGGTVKNSSGVAAPDEALCFEAPWPCILTAVRAARKGGTGATINMRKNYSADHLASDLSLPAAVTTYDGGAVQNASYLAGDVLEVAVRSVAGAPTEVSVWAYLVRT